MNSGSDIFIIHNHQVLVGRKATYANAVCDCRLLKYDPYCVRITVWEDRIIYPGDPRANAESLMDSKIALNITISTPGAHFF